MSRAIVIGAGLGGLVAANRLADAGLSVVLLTKGLGGLQLGQGTIDVLGYRPERVTNPILELAQVSADHPYATIGADAVHAGLAYLLKLVPDLLVGDAEANYLLPTAVGALRPTCLAQPSMLAGHASAGKRLVIVGLKRLKDFQPKLIAQNLARTDLPDGGRMVVRHLSVDVAARDELDSSGLAYARAFDDAAFRARFAAALKPLLAEGEVLGLPAVVGLHDLNAWRDVAERLGHQVFEIPLPPPSVPGMRLNEALTARAKAAGVRFVPGVRTVGFTAESGVVQRVSSATEPARRDYRGDVFVLATGGFESGALVLDSYGTVTETLFGLPLAGTEGPLINGDYWSSEQPLFRAGVRVDSAMRPLAASGEPVYGNLFAVGGVLAGASRWREKSGDGIAVASAIAASDQIVKEWA